MTTTSGAPVEAPPDDESTRRSGNQLLVLASEATILVGAGWLIAMVVPYLAAPDGTTIALADGDPLRASTIGPRLVGVLLSAGPAALALALPRWRAALFCTSAAALATLAAYSVWWALAVRTGFGFAPCVGWFGDLVLTAAAVATITIGGLGVGRSLTGRPRLLDRRLLPSTPYVAVATAVVAVTSDWLLSRDPLFPTAFALGSSAMATEHVSIATRSAALAIALILLVVPVMATSARERRVGEGLAVGWIAAVAIPSTRVLLTPGHTPDAAFAAGLVLVGLATIALLMWLALSGRTRPPVP